MSDKFLLTDGKYIQTRASCLLVFATHMNFNKNISQQVNQKQGKCVDTF
jgi:hypothetical protein